LFILKNKQSFAFFMKYSYLLHGKCARHIVRKLKDSSK
jgi:hypothetical protein